MKATAATAAMRKGSTAAQAPGWAAVVWILAGSAMAASAEGPGTVAEFARLSPTARFQRWLSAPPRVERLVFLEKLPPDPARPVSLLTGIADSTRYTAGVLAWEPQSVAFHEVATTNDLRWARFPGVAFTFANNRFSLFESPTNLLHYHLEMARVAAGEFPPAYDLATYRMRRALEPLTLGLSHILPGEVTWSGNDFQATGLADRKPIQLRGTITGFVDDVPSELSVEYRNPAGVARYRIQYAYHRYAAPYFPSSITLLFEYQGRSIEYRTYRIVELRIQDGPLSPAAFDPLRMVDGPAPTARLLTNDALYVVLPSGKLLKAAQLSTPGVVFTRADFHRARYVYLALGLGATGFLVLFVRARRMERNESGVVEP